MNTEKMWPIAILTIASSCASADLLYQAPLQSGDYGGGDQIGIDPVGCPQTSPCSAPPTGILETSQGAHFAGPEALINFDLANDHPAHRSPFRSEGTVSIRILVDSESFDSGALFEDNYGYGGFRGGQVKFGSGLSPDGDSVTLNWRLWINSVWYAIDPRPTFTPDEWHHIGLAWGGPDNDMEVCIDGEVVAVGNLPAGVSLPWGGGSPEGAANFGIGTNHERGYDAPASLNAATGVTYADLQIWDEYVASCATQSPSPSWDTAYETIFAIPADLDVLRTYRDQVLETDRGGSALVSDIYAHSDKLLIALLANPELMRRANGLIDENIQAIQIAANGGQGMLRAPHALLSFLDALGRESSPAVRPLIARAKQRIERCMRAGEEAWPGLRCASAAENRRRH